MVCGPIEPTILQLELWAVLDNGASEAIIMYEANDIWIQHGKDKQVNTCQRMIRLCRVGMLLDYTNSLIQLILIAHNCLMSFHLQMLCISGIHLSQSRYMQPNRGLISANIALI
jgi:hypothetical protein